MNHKNIEFKNHEVVIRSDNVELKSFLAIPKNCTGLVLFAHGSDSSRLSPRNQYVAHVLNHYGLATIVADLLTEEESNVRSKVFDIGLLSSRVTLITKWIYENDDLRDLPLAYFGASTGAAAALEASTHHNFKAYSGSRIRAIVSRGGRPDLAHHVLSRVDAPTLFIVGSHDVQVMELNIKAYDELKCEKRLEIVPGAGHLFQEPGSLEHVAGLAVGWFINHMKMSDEAVSPIET